MFDAQNTLLNLVKPLCKDKDNVSVKQLESINENEILLYFYAQDSDIARLIGKQGVMASSIRQMMQVASKIENKHITIKFEAL